MESSENLDIILLVSVGTAAMALLAGFIIFFVVLYQKKTIIQRNELEAIKSVHQRELLQKTIEVEASERERIAKNIHDDLGALISVLRLNNSRTAKNINNVSVLTQINEATNEILNKTSESIRHISKKLASPTLTKLGFEAALRELCTNFNQTEEIRMSFTNNLFNPMALSTQKASHLYRASQEIINNIIKHARAQKVSIELFALENKILIKFEHDGLGINDEDVHQLMRQEKGLGLSSIQNRLSIIAGNITYLNEPNHFPQILITYPNDESQD